MSYYRLMAANFDPNLSTTRDHARSLLGDTIVVPATAAILPDETYAGYLSAYSYSIAVGLLADSILNIVAQEPDRIREMTGNTYEWNKRLDGWSDISRRGAAGNIPEPGVIPETLADERRTTQVPARPRYR